MVLALVTGCTSAPLRIGSNIPPGAQLTAGRPIAGSGCSFMFGTGYEAAYQQLTHAAGRDLITDVEVSGGINCTTFHARAVKIMAPSAAAPPAPAVASSVPRPVVAAAPAAVFEKGASARLKPGAVVRTRPRPEGDPVDIAAAAILQLDLRMRNEAGSWWYVGSGGKSGWVLESDLEPVAP